MAKDLPHAARETVLRAIQSRASSFQFADFRRRLASADSAFHLANVRTQDTEGNKQSDSYSRFQEIDNSVVREVAESYASFYIDSYISKNKLFTMTSPADQQETAQLFNAVLQDQDRQTQQKANISKFLLDCAKYNFGMVEVAWDIKELYSPTINALQLKTETEVTANYWEGNHIKWLDPYNVFFDTSVPPHSLHEDGEFAGYTEQYTQMRLFRLMQQLKTIPNVSVYDRDWRNLQFSVYNVPAGGGITPKYYQPDIKPLGMAATIDTTAEFDWTQHIEGSKSKELNSWNSSSRYEITTVVLRLVPSSYGIPATTKPEKVETWKFWVLDGSWLLASQRLDSAHNYLPFVIGQPDSDSLGINTGGPAQVAIPYQKLIKQLTDRVLAGADRAIRGKSLYDPTYINKDDINTSIPDANIPLRKPLTQNRSIDQVFRNIDFRGDTTGLGDLAQQGRAAALQAGGINNSQIGQFTKGNRTLEEYNDVQANAVSRQFIRLLVLESTAMSAIKRMLKLNILQYQKAAELFNPETQQEVTVTPEALYKSEVDYVLADAFSSSEYMLSPNVQQQLLQVISMQPQLFAEYDIAKMIVHIMQQSNGVDMQQYKYTPEQLKQLQAQAQAAQQGAQQ